ncbi:MAG: hypothetical protein A2600_02450 [Candidatus Lambdaproteobacteria bacterium RIFOXYD1_FULL_56_27]|uniref:Uncharacterized protein n=1 Tax=Candidatus Lambdaproteobacteria bacterium RIFOXYD2_FULL_56_26 TaxID=1817773 RepID=A0A1F6H2Y1_9PROT|nr:MAG: hypothetical protein A2426_09490 [Candidatus Lambdaproteobacteria bacterium RIFOXYC1_FULL_56_13]OGH04640.1 MAG: hypothetical protein A2557_06515 [Candidatus Lambdaproteobacteria bacterium RIFOXYD2_FULL_56_26]OGH09104.1 MAG: hypothetical protein A2600_02450 [Candidatus Lambdaproteobacteria bacterium RIFOXYD1_FULL_56_27]
MIAMTTPVTASLTEKKGQETKNGLETVKFEHNFLPPPGRSNQGEGENHFQEGKLKVQRPGLF